MAILGAGLPAGLNAQIVAAVLLFRLATWLVPIPLGLVSYLYWRDSTQVAPPRGLARRSRRPRGPRPDRS